MELLFALELLFIIRPGAPDHGAAGAPLLVLVILLILPSLPGFMDAARTEMIRECAFTFEVTLAVAAPELCRGRKRSH